MRFEQVQIAGIACERVTATAGTANGILLYLHGGGFVLGSPRSWRSITGRLALASRLTVVVPDYRLAPEYPHPAALDDAAAVYGALAAAGTPPPSLAGDSAGGGLALALCLRLRGGSLPVPASLALISPWADLTNASLAPIPDDPLLSAGWLEACASAYAGGQSRRTPSVSPLLGDLSGLPPTLIHAAGQELLRDDARRLAAALEQAGGSVQLTEHERLWHDHQL